LKKEQKKSSEVEEEKQSGEVTRRDFLVGAGTVVVGGAIGAGLLSSCNGGETVTTTVEKTKTFETTTTIGGDGAITVTATETVGAGETVTATTTITQPGGVAYPASEPEESFAMIPGGNSMEYGAIDVKNGKVIRVRPLHYEEDNTKEEVDACMWSFDAKNRKTGETMTISSRRHRLPAIWLYLLKSVLLSQQN
jgi:hypothetical protein